MSRLRIRTIKPECWTDERIGHLSRDARLFFVGLITQADDEGRLRAIPATLVGNLYPYDKDAPRKLQSWIDEVAAHGLVVPYEHAGVPYLAFRHWKRHQRINRSNPSVHPAPPDQQVVTDNAVNTHVNGSEPVVSV